MSGNDNKSCLHTVCAWLSELRSFEVPHVKYFDVSVAEEGSAGRLRCRLNMHFGTVFGMVVVTELVLTRFWGCLDYGLVPRSL